MNRPQSAYDGSNRDHRDQQPNGQGSGYNQQGPRNHQQHSQHSNHPYQRNWSNQHNNNYRNSNRPQGNRGCYQIETNQMASFFVHPHSMYKEQLPAISQPVEVGIILSDKRRENLDAKLKTKQSIEVEGSNEQVKDKSFGIKYLALPSVTSNLDFDLKLGIEHFGQHIPHQKGIDTVLQWIVEHPHLMVNKANPSDSSKSLTPDFICWRGLLTALACSPYERNKDNMFSIILFKGTFYMCEIETESQKHERLNMTDQNRAFTYWGHKFESYISVDSPDEVPNGAADVPDPEDNYAAAIARELGKMKLFYCAEIDACMQKEHNSLNDYCEIKTARGNGLKDLNVLYFKPSIFHLSRNMKFAKWWVQSYLAGIEKIIIGFRSDDGIVHSISDIQTKDLINKNPLTSYSSFKRWSREVCFNFLKKFLEFVKLFCKKEKTVYIAERALDSDHFKIIELDPESERFKANFFLRDWYIEAIEKLHASA